MVAKLEKDRMTAIFASSEGWKVMPMTGTLIQRVASLMVTHMFFKPGILMVAMTAAATMSEGMAQ